MVKIVNHHYKIAELEQAAALKYLYSWLRHHPKYGTLAPMEQSDSLYYADVSFTFSNFCVYVFFFLSPAPYTLHLPEVFMFLGRI